MKGKHKYWGCLVIVTVLLFSLSPIALASDLGVRNLDTGMKGNDVRLLQQRLNDLGYKVRVDGIFGTGTKAVVKKFQQKHDLVADGVVGSETLIYLKKVNNDLSYKVQSGDTLHRIAKKYDVSVQKIKEINDLSTSKIVVGQELVIPDTALGGGNRTELHTTVEYKVKPGDSISKLAKEYDSEVAKIKQVNNLQNSLIKVGQRLKIPRRLKKIKVKETNSRSRNLKFIWPIRGGISSEYGTRINPITREEDFHGGIDMSVSTGTKVKATAEGKVLTSSWIRGFGRTVIIRHNNRIKTLYAHNSRLLVETGQRVKRGQVIAYSGNTGRSTGPHLHFAVLVNDEPVDPLKWLP